MILDTIYNQDCLIGMKDLPDASIDCIITDLPYGVLNRSNASAQWDCIIPFEPMWEQFLRVAKHDAPIILFAQGMFTAQLMLSQPKIWRYNLVWDKYRPTGFLNANRMPMRIHEDICIFYRDMPVYNPQMTKAAPHARNHGRGSGNHVNKNQCYGQWSELRSTISDEKYPVSIIKIPKEHKADTFHPTQKPVALLRYLIRTYTKSGGVVLDCCIGSGTTAIAALIEHRHFIGYETDKDYYSRALKRIEEQKSVLSFDFSE